MTISHSLEMEAFKPFLDTSNPVVHNVELLAFVPTAFKNGFSIR
jgi:hypothetical protein